jgi:DNA-binding transcriptional regulator of glucitol operon
VRWTRLLMPSWLLRHALAAAAAYGCQFLGSWQLGRAHATHSIQNYGYAFQWWTFAVVGTVWYLKVLRDVVRLPAGERLRKEKVRDAPVLRQGVARTVDDITDAEDPALAAYNRMLAGLDRSDSAGAR